MDIRTYKKVTSKDPFREYARDLKKLILFDDYQCSGRSIDPSDGSAVSHRSRALIGDKKSQKLQDNILKDVNAHD